MREIQDSLTKIQQWCLKNELYISEDKTKIMMVTPKYNECTFVLHQETCSINNCDQSCKNIEVVNNFTYLGMTLDYKWAFGKHIDKIVNKLRTITPKLYAVRNCLTLKNKKVIYDAWILDKVSYFVRDSNLWQC